MVYLPKMLSQAKSFLLDALLQKHKIADKRKVTKDYLTADVRSLFLRSGYTEKKLDQEKLDEMVEITLRELVKERYVEAHVGEWRKRAWILDDVNQFRYYKLTSKGIEYAKLRRDTHWS